MSTQGPGAAGMSPLLQQMLTENPAMGAAMQQAMAPGLASLPSSADLLQQAHALQLLAQLQSVLMMNTRDKVRHEDNVKELELKSNIKEGGAFILNGFYLNAVKQSVWLYAMLLQYKMSSIAKLAKCLFLKSLNYNACLSWSELYCMRRLAVCKHAKICFCYGSYEPII